MSSIDELRVRLDDTDPNIRRAAVRELETLRASGKWQPPAVRPWMNLHAHTFHSFNAEGWSPSRLVFEAVDAGLEIVGSVDFDVLDALEEVLPAGDCLGIKSVVGLESRVYIPEYADKVINSPGEPGISYFMATGCTRLPEAGGQGARTLASLKEIAQNRNREMIARINPFLEKVQVDYTTDLLPLSPSGNPTERHLVEAYDRKSRAVFPSGGEDLVRFWANALDLPCDRVESLIEDGNSFRDTLRSRLMKRGGVGYTEPDPSSFPTLDSVIALAQEIGALPTCTFLDGTSPGEEDMGSMLVFMVKKGIEALNIIPDRNWNLKDSEEKALKISKLREAVEAARNLDLPLCIGTEMNKAGQPFVDDFDAPELAPFVEDFRKGARALWGHTLLCRGLDFGWESATAKRHFGDSQKRRFEFYHEVGKRFAAGKAGLETVKGLLADPSEILKTINGSPGV